jgi:hypothetical protein
MSHAVHVTGSRGAAWAPGGAGHNATGAREGGAMRGAGAGVALSRRNGVAWYPAVATEKRCRGPGGAGYHRCRGRAVAAPTDLGRS